MNTAVALPAAVKVPVPKDFLHDVFISYSYRDLDWVRDFLLPQLEQAGLRVIIDYRDYVIGLPKLKNLEQAIDTSRFTLAVLTPSWVESEWQDWEGLLTSVEGITRRKRRLIPLLLEDCEPPSHIASLTSANFTQPERRAEEMQRLLRNLLRDRGPGPSVSEQSPQQGLTALLELMRRNPDVQASVIKSQAALKAVVAQIRVVTAYKQIHDCFQTLETAYELLVRNVKRLPNDAAAWEDLERDESHAFRPRLEELVEKTRQAPFAGTETRWLSAVELDGEKLRAAIENQDLPSCRAALDDFADRLSREPSRINTKLFDKANELRLTGTPEQPGLVEEYSFTA